MAPTRSPRNKRRARWTTARKQTPRKAKVAESVERREEGEEEEEELWEIEYISEARCRLKEGEFYWEYRVKWLNWEHKDDSWERYENFAADSDILQSFWEDIDDLNSRGNGITGNIDITYSGRRVYPSDRWINERKAMAMAATDLRLHKAPDPRAVSPYHGPAPTDAESLWQQGGKDDDDDPGSQSESECNSVTYGDDNDDNSDFGGSTPEREVQRNAAGRVYASIPDNPRRYHRKEKAAQKQEGNCGINTPRILGQLAREAQQRPGPQIFIKPTRDDGVIRADKKGMLELHPRGPVRARPKPIRLFTAEELRRIEETRYENCKALLEGTLAADEDGENQNEEHIVDEDQDKPASPLDPHEEYRRLKQQEPLFLADNNQDDAHSDNENDVAEAADYPPASSPVPESPRTPPHDRLAIRSFLAPILERTAEAALADALDMAAPAAEYDDKASDVFESRPNSLDAPPMPEVDLGELISHEYLDAGGAGLAAIWERGPSMETLASAETMAGEADEVGPRETDKAKPAGAVATVKDDRSKIGDDADAMDVDEEDQIELELDSENAIESIVQEDYVDVALEKDPVEAALEENSVEAALEEIQVEDDLVEVESELEEGEIRE